MNAAGRGFLTLKPLLDASLSPEAVSTMQQGLEDYDQLRSRVMSRHDQGQAVISQLHRNVPELNLR